MVWFTIVCPYCRKKIPINSIRCPECRAVIPHECGEKERGLILKLMLVGIGLVVLVAVGVVAALLYWLFW